MSIVSSLNLEINEVPSVITISDFSKQFPSSKVEFSLGPNNDTRMFSLDGLYVSSVNKYVVLDETDLNGSRLVSEFKRVLTFLDRILNFLGFSNWVGFFDKKGVRYVNLKEEDSLLVMTPFFCSASEAQSIFSHNTQTLITCLEARYRG